MTGAADVVTVGETGEVVVGAGEDVGVLDGESSPHAVASSSIAASQPTRTRTKFRRGRRQSREGLAAGLGIVCTRFAGSLGLAVVTVCTLSDKRGRSQLVEAL